MKRKIAVVTGSRAEYGLLYWIIRGIHEDPDLVLQLLVTGMHLSSTFGMTVKEIENDGFPIAARVPMLEESDTEGAIVRSMGRGIIGFAEIYECLHPDVIVVLGDRFEVFAAVAAAVPFRIPVAHIHGGESTEGLIDESVRHAVTKMSHLHFTSAELYRQRVIQMGEDPKRVFCVGAPGLDSVYRLKLRDRGVLLDELDVETKKPLGVVTFHPVTLEKNAAKAQMNELLSALERFSDMFWVITMPNADTEGRTIIREIDNFVQKHSDCARAFLSLGQLNYFSLLQCAAVMVGNSSSGLIEAPSFALPVVNIGDRQRGRIRGENVIDVQECRMETITTAINKAISKEFNDALHDVKNPYGDGMASNPIVVALKAASLGEGLIKKKFHKIL